MGKSCDVSIIVPTYNYARFLRDCVESVLAQAKVDVRVLIIDDASTDDSEKIAKELAAADSRVELQSHLVNQGHIRTYNEGLAWGNGTYSMVLDADDILTSGSLRRGCDLLNVHPELGFVYGRVKVFQGNRRPPKARDAKLRWKSWKGLTWFEQLCRLTENCVRQPSVLVRTSLLKKIGGFRTELPHTADMELWMRLALHAHVGYIATPYQAFYRDHAAGLHRQRFGTPLAHLAQIAAAFETIFRNYSHQIPNHQPLENSVRRTLAQRMLNAACSEYESGWRDLSEAARLEQLALATYEQARGLNEWHGLEWRRRLGPIGRMASRSFSMLTNSSHYFRRLRIWRAHRTGIP